MTSEPIMKDEVEDFLRRVAQLRAQAEAQARGQQQRPAAPPPPQRPVQAPPQRMVPPPRALSVQEEAVYLEPAEAEIVDAELSDSADEIGRHVTQHLRGVREIAEHTRHLGAEVDQADEKLESHLHSVFDHKLGNLRKTASDTAAVEHAKPAPDVTLSEIRDFLRSPATIRDAIVMSEILRRPDERW